MNLIARYNVPAPRYTSYPTVPAWHASPSQEEWKNFVSRSFVKTNKANGISLYIHLPYCESLCTYCACNTRITVNHRVELPYIETLLKEWKLYLSLFNERPRIREFHLGGGTPTFFSAENLHKLVSGILEHADVCQEHDFSFEGHPSNTTYQHLSTLHALGFNRVSFGIQDFDPLVQDTINRYQSYEEVEKVVKEAREIGYTSVNFDLVYGLPFQKIKTITDTLNKVNALRPDRIAFYSYAHVPWLKPGQRKFTEKDLPVDEEKRELYETGLRLFKLAGYAGIGMDHFSLISDDLYSSMQSGTLHRNFMGYTTHYTELMVSLGASSISDTGACFAQNIKVVEPYQAAVEAGNFPIFKGHKLGNHDIILRKHILNLMCRGETTWGDDIPGSLISAVLKRCEKPMEDGLVTIEGNTITVTEKGEPYKRMVCACFDEYFNYEEPVRKFSTVI